MRLNETVDGQLACAHGWPWTASFRPPIGSNIRCPDCEKLNMPPRIKPEDAKCFAGRPWLNHRWPAPFTGPGCPECEARGQICIEKLSRAELKALDALKQDNSERPPKKKRTKKHEVVAE
jgi:hypothetical protein